MLHNIKSDFQWDPLGIRQSIRHQQSQMIPPPSQAPTMLHYFPPSATHLDNPTGPSIHHAEYSSILLLNAQSVNPSAKSLCKWKLPYVSENFLYNIHTNIPILRISESWLKSYKTDAQIHIKDFVPIRSDRSIRKGGGAIHS